MTAPSRPKASTEYGGSPPRGFRALTLVLLALLSIPASLASIFVVIYLFVVPSRDMAIPMFVAFGNRAGEAVPEEALMDPLIVARGDIVPDVCEAILKPTMPKRRYAIGFLGERGDVRALPSLLKILQHPTEDALFRGDALDAIFAIDPGQGRRLANGFATRSDYLGARAKSALTGEESPPRRTYGQALQTYVCVLLEAC